MSENNESLPLPEREKMLRQAGQFYSFRNKLEKWVENRYGKAARDSMENGDFYYGVDEEIRTVFLLHIDISRAIDRIIGGYVYNESFLTDWEQTVNSIINGQKRDK